jgi:tetratricopeptide (TPR) repeat protein
MMGQNHQHQITPHAWITRRDLFALATISPSLLTKIQRGWLSASVIEEFLSEATASVTTCWYSLQGDGLSLVEWALPQYLPELVEVVKFSPLYRQRAAYLAAQGFLLLSLIDLHHLRYAERVAHCQEAVTYAHESGDLTLLIASLVKLSHAFRTNGQLAESLDTYLQAKRYSKSTEIAGFSRGIVRSGLGHAYAKQGKSEEVTRFQDEARATFTEKDAETPIFLSASHGFYEIILDEGLSSLALGDYEQKQRNLDRAQKYWKEAAKKFGQIEQLSSGIVVPARIAAEVEIARALAYAKAGNMEAFITSFEKGVRAAKALGSEKRMQEAREAYRVAREQWPHEQRILDLWEVVF